MKSPSSNSLIMLLFLLVSSTIYADSTGVKLSTNPQQRLIIENLNLSGAKFLAAYLSKDVQQRQLAEMYLAGVLDAGEGKLWCGYSIALPSSLQEVIYIGFKNQSPESLNRRASEVIDEILATKLFCSPRRAERDSGSAISMTAEEADRPAGICPTSLPTPEIITPLKLFTETHHDN